MNWTARERSAFGVLVALLLLSSAAHAWAEDPDRRYAAVRDAYLELREDEERQRFRHNHLGILDDFEAFVADHPEHDSAPAALYNAGQLAWDLYRVSRVSGDLRRSRDLFLRLSEEYPSSSLADDGLFLNGRILLEHGGDPKEAYRTFQAVIERFPTGDMAPKAKELLQRLSDHAPEPVDESITEARQKAEKSARVVARSGSWQGSAGSEVAVVGAPSAEASGELVRVTIPLSERVRFREGEVPADESRGLPRRAYIDLKPARLDAPAFEVSVERAGISRARLGQFSPNTVRLVLDLSEDREVGIFPLVGESSLVVDLTDQDGPAPDPIANLQGLQETKERDSKEPADEDVQASTQALAGETRARLEAPQEVPLSVQAGLKVRRVVIDPGHGGHDVGAVGPSGLQEKGVVLDISKKLGRRLQEHGLEVVYTRTEDEFVSLDDRTAIANDERADLFISVHANATTRRDRRGVTTYYLDVTSDRYSMRLAARENATTERSVSELQLILADLTTRHNTDESARLASRIQENLVETLSREYSDVRDLGVRYALFFVLLGARMPSVLVETSFISNPAEERRLADEAYRDEVAEGIFEGVLAFIAERDRLALGN